MYEYNPSHSSNYSYRALRDFVKPADESEASAYDLCNLIRLPTQDHDIHARVGILCSSRRGSVPHPPVIPSHVFIHSFFTSAFIMNVLRLTRQSVLPRVPVISSAPRTNFCLRHTHASLRPRLYPPRPPKLGARYYQQNANPPQTQTPKPVAKPPSNPVQKLGEEVHVSQAEQRRKDWNIIKTLALNLWPKNDWSTRGRILFGVGLLIAGKVRRMLVVQ